jgi:RNA polymerase sigma-54 factor
MGLAPRLELRQSHSLVMTPQLRQSIQLLQMTGAELAAFVEAEIEANPLLERMRPPERVPPPRAPELGRAFGDQGGAELAAAAVTLAEHLRRQIGASRRPAALVRIALILVEEIDEDGYLRASAAELAARYGVPPDALRAAIELVQGCEPAGVGARSLAECLRLQLRELDRLDPAMQALLDHLDLLADGRHAELPAICRVDAADLADMLAELRALDPKPGLRFAAQPIAITVPDVFVTRSAGEGWTVELNGEALPRVLVDNAYAVEIGARDARARGFISECSAKANWLIRSLEQRARTVLRVASEIVRHQERFFGEGPSGLRPLTQRAVADRLRLHESTVSRVTAGKYLACDRGCFELRHFFSSSIQAVSGGEAFAAAAVQARIRALIGGEAGDKPWSDDGLVGALKAEGIDIARRTVAKYREGMGIPSSIERRRLKSAFSKS